MICVLFFVKQKTAYEMRISDWSSDVCSSDLACGLPLWPGMAVQLLAGLIVFMAFAVLFALGCMGGGDVKLLGALALWFPWQATLSMLMLMAVLGGIDRKSTRLNSSH